jgi:hypothetical protein
VKHIAPAVAAALLLAACGGTAAGTAERVASLETDTTTIAAEAAGAEMSDEEAAMAFTECMREQGVEMEDPTVDAEGNVTPGRPTDLPEPGSDEEPGAFGDDMRTAFDACSEYLQGTSFGFSGEDVTELEDQLLEYTTCLRDQGLEVSDPDLTGGGPGNGGGDGGGPLGLDFDDPEVQAAMEACADVAPNVGRGFGGGRGGGPPG